MVGTNSEVVTASERCPLCRGRDLDVWVSDHKGVCIGCGHIYEKAKGKKAVQVGGLNDITIKINSGVNECGIEAIHMIEKAMGEALRPLGFSRSTTTKADHCCELVYCRRTNKE